MITSDETDRCNTIIHHVLYLTDNFGTFPIFASASGTRPAIHGQSDHERAGTGAEGTTEGEARGISACSRITHPTDRRWFYLLAHIFQPLSGARGGMSLYSASGAAVRKEGRKGEGGRSRSHHLLPSPSPLRSKNFGLRRRKIRSGAASKSASDAREIRRTDEREGGESSTLARRCC